MALTYQISIESPFGARDKDERVMDALIGSL